MRILAYFLEARCDSSCLLLVQLQQSRSTRNDHSGCHASARKSKLHAGNSDACDRETGVEKQGCKCLAEDIVVSELVSWQYQVSGSFVEVYNENINVLLGRPEDFDKKKHEIRHDMQKSTTTITDVIETPLESAEHFGTVLARALENRSIAATKANERSSRSHSVCILRIEGQNPITGESCSSTLNLVDLAGSERLAHSQATGAQLKETQNINKSLSCLKDVIAALGDAKEGSHVPYRNSKVRPGKKSAQDSC